MIKYNKFNLNNFWKKYIKNDILFEMNQRNCNFMEEIIRDTEDEYKQIVKFLGAIIKIEKLVFKL